MSENKNCGNCVHWKGDVVGRIGVRECGRIHPLWEAEEWIDGRHQVTEDGKESLAFVQDGSEYLAMLYTKPEFYCNLWKGK